MSNAHKPYFQQRAYDGKWAVYRYMQWPDDYIDSMPDHEYLEWMISRDNHRAYGWITVAVFPNRWLAMDWLKNFWSNKNA